jgi:hypothetical protein
VFFTFILLFNNTDPSASEEEEMSKKKGFSAFYKMTKIGEVAISKARKY